MTIGREEFENLGGQNSEKPRQSKHKYSSAWKHFEGGRRSSASNMHSVHFPMDKVGFTSESPQGKTASLCLAPERSPEQDQHTFLPSRLLIVRMALMVVIAQWVAQAQWRPLLIKWRLTQVWRARVGVKLSCRGRRIFHGSERKQRGNERFFFFLSLGKATILPPNPHVR